MGRSLFGVHLAGRQIGQQPEKDSKKCVRLEKLKDIKLTASSQDENKSNFPANKHGNAEQVLGQVVGDHDDAIYTKIECMQH